jgi:transposase
MQKQFSEEYRKKLSDAKKGKRRDPAIMKKMHDKNCKKILDTNTGVVYNSLGELSKHFNVHNSTAGRWVKNNNSQFKLVI